MNNKQETLEVFEYGATRRRTAETRLNERSSRSHGVFTIKIETKVKRKHLIKNDNESQLFSNCSSSQNIDCMENIEKIANSRVKNVKTKAMFHFIDLAGSERQYIDGPVALQNSDMLDRSKESCKINQSLVVLSNVIASLSKGQKYPHFRDSKLTYYLKDIFGGNARTTLITNIVNESAHLFETYNTLRFGQTAKTIKVNYKANCETIGGTEEDLKAEINYL